MSDHTVHEYIVREVWYPVAVKQELVGELVRCKDCLYWQQNTVRQNSNDAGWWNEALCERHTIYGNEPHEAWTDADWYCADGERKGE